MDDQTKSMGFDEVHEARTRLRQRKERAVEVLGDLIEPQTEGYDHINMDMAFTYLNPFNLWQVQNDSMLITLCKIYNLKQSEYLVRGKLATLLNANKSLNAKSMELYTTVLTKHEGSYVDKTEKKQGFGLWNPFQKKT